MANYAASKNGASMLYWPLLLVSLAFTFLAFSLPIYSKALGASAFEIGGLFSIFTITILFGRPLVGWALDRYGRRPFLIAALVGYAFTMTFFAIADDLIGLYLARFIQGIASSLMWITIHTIVADVSAPHERGKLMGWASEAGMRGEIIGVFLGFGLFAYLSDARSEGAGWQAAFFLYAASALLGAFVAWKNVPETRPANINTNESNKILSPALLKLLVVVFSMAIANMMITPIYLIYLQDKFTTEMGTLAWAFFPAGVVASLLPSRLGKLSDRFGRAPMMAIGLLGSGLLSFLIPLLPNLIWLTALYTLAAVGWAMAGPAEAAMVADLSWNENRGRGYGFYEFASSLGMTLGPLLGGWLYDHISQTAPFFASGIVLLVSAAWVMLFLRQKKIESLTAEN